MIHSEIRPETKDTAPRPLFNRCSNSSANFKFTTTNQIEQFTPRRAAFPQYEVKMQKSEEMPSSGISPKGLAGKY
jgi:hypothetical protein